MATSETQFLCAEKTLPRRFHLDAAGLFLITVDSSTPADHHPAGQHSLVPEKQRFYFSRSDLLLIEANSSSPDDQTLQILNSKYAMTPIESLIDSQTLLWDVISQVFILCISLNILTF